VAKKFGIVVRRCIDKTSRSRRIPVGQIVFPSVSPSILPGKSSTFTLDVG